MLKSSTIWLGLFASIATVLIVLMGNFGLFKLMIMFLIMSNKEIINSYKKYGKFKVIKNCFSYNSGNNKYFLNKNKILSLLKKYFINDFA